MLDNKGIRSKDITSLKLTAVNFIGKNVNSGRDLEGSSEKLQRSLPFILELK